MPNAVFEWEGVEYDHDPKSADWYWAVGIVTTALLIASVLFGNYLLALLVLIAAVTIALHAAKRPSTHRFTLTDRGLLIGTDLHPFEKMHSFSMLEYIEGNKPPVLSIKTDSWLYPHLIIPLTSVNPDELYVYLLRHVEEAEHDHTLTDMVAAWLGF